MMLNPLEGISCHNHLELYMYLILKARLRMPRDVSLERKKERVEGILEQVRPQSQSYWSERFGLFSEPWQAIKDESRQ